MYFDKLGRSEEEIIKDVKDFIKANLKQSDLKDNTATGKFARKVAEIAVGKPLWLIEKYAGRKVETPISDKPVESARPLDADIHRPKGKSVPGSDKPSISTEGSSMRGDGKRNPFNK